MCGASLKRKHIAASTNCNGWGWGGGVHWSRKGDEAGPRASTVDPQHLLTQKVTGRRLRGQGPQGLRKTDTRMSPDGLLLRQSCKSLAEKWRVHVNRELSSNGPISGPGCQWALGLSSSFYPIPGQREKWFLSRDSVVAVTGEADQAGSDKEGLCGGQVWKRLGGVQRKKDPTSGRWWEAQGL